MDTQERRQRGTLRGAVYGDLVGAPYMIENTYNRYFPLGESRRAFSHGKVRSFFPEVTEVSHGAAAVCNWLTTYRDNPTAEALQRCLRNQFLSHPRGGWTEPTRLFFSSGNGLPSETPDWAAVTRAVPIASFVRDDLFGALELAEACVRATCSNDDTVRMAQALTHGIYMARNGAIQAEIFTTLEMQYGLHLTWRDEDLQAELRGEVREPLVMLGAPVEGAWHYRLPERPSPPSARIVTEAAVRAVTRSDSWEDAVRRAVAYGGPSNAVAGIAGGLAEALYGEVTPTIVGKLFPYIPTDIIHQMDSYDQAASIRLERSARPYTGIVEDAFSVIQVSGRPVIAVVPEESRAIRRVLRRDHPEVDIITPEARGELLARYREVRSGTFAYGPVPEVSTYYLQDGERIVSPSHYIAPGMPPLQERRRHLGAFQQLRTFCMDCQRRLNEAAGNPGAGQVHYGGAFHLWIGQRRIDFFYGDSLAGRLSLTEKGLLKVSLGDYRDLSADARFENHREQAWAARSVFTIAQSSDPLGHLEDIRSCISSRLLDEGLGDGLVEADSRYLSDEERRERSEVSNIDHLEPLDEGEPLGSAPLPNSYVPIAEKAPGDRAQEVRTVYSIGYGMRSQQGFINTLKMMDVDTVIDIRSIPRSRLAPQFDADTIYEALGENDVDFFLAGDHLGGRPSDLSLYDGTGTVDWEALRESDSYREALSAVEKKASEGHIIALVCSEGDPLFSHRFGTVSRDLREKGFQVRHILPNGEIVSHAEMEARLVEKYDRKGILTSSLTESYARQLEEAYRVLNQERGFKMKSTRDRGYSTRKVRF